MKRWQSWVWPVTLFVVVIGFGHRLLADAAAEPQARPDSSKPSDIVPPATPTGPRPRGMIEALKEQMQRSPLLQDDEITVPLLDSLDDAARLYDRAKQQNRQALDRLKHAPNRGVTASPRAQAGTNVILIVLDRLNPDHLTASGDEVLPAVSAWRKRGVTFQTAYAGSADLETSFWSMLVGRNTGRLPPGQGTTRDVNERLSWPAHLQRTDIATACVGHWGMTPHPLDVGFDYFCGVLGEASAVLDHPSELNLGRTTMTLSTESPPTLWKLLAIEVQQWMAARSEEDRRFAMIVRLPCLTSDVRSPSPETLRGWNEVLAAVEQTLDGHGLQGTTHVIVTALGSEAAAASGLSQQELRVPLVITGPYLSRSGESLSTPVALWDLAPTVADLAGAPVLPYDRDGQSLWSRESSDSARKARLFYWRAPALPRNQAVCKGTWKGLYFAKDQRMELYDLATDPDGRNNIAQLHPEVVRSLLLGQPEQVDALMKRVESER